MKEPTTEATVEKIENMTDFFIEAKDSKKTGRVDRKKIICESTYFYGSTQQRRHA